MFFVLVRMILIFSYYRRFKLVKISYLLLQKIVLLVMISVSFRFNGRKAFKNITGKWVFITVYRLFTSCGDKDSKGIFCINTYCEKITLHFIKKKLLIYLSVRIVFWINPYTVERSNCVGVEFFSSWLVLNRLSVCYFEDCSVSYESPCWWIYEVFFLWDQVIFIAIPETDNLSHALVDVIFFNVWYGTAGN